ncbi:hypothetical protein [Methanosarcina sp.]|uniref:hypothetical protein n=1 Tax=Methanosarcina sp. TaxID=2213 RepID=UPI003BB612CC
MHYMVHSSRNIQDAGATEIYNNPDILYEKLGYDPEEWRILLDAWTKDMFGVDVYVGDLIRDVFTGLTYEVEIKDGRFKAISGKTEIMLDDLECIRVMGSIVDHGRPMGITA